MGNALRPWSDLDIDLVAGQLNQLRMRMANRESRFAQSCGFNGSNRQSALNLIHYLALREHDVRELQDRLAALGLSSLGRCEPQVMATIDHVLDILSQLGSSSSAASQLTRTLPSAEEWQSVLESRTAELLGAKPSARSVRIMVTMPTEAAGNYDLVRDLVAHGMDCMRINCVYDDAATWGRMIANLQRARTELKKPCSILMDVPGPKIRTGTIARGAQVVRFRPHRNELGQVLSPARVWLTPAEAAMAPTGPADASLQAPEEWLTQCSVDDKIKFTDARGAKRTLKVTGAEGASRWAEISEAAYVTPETELRLRKLKHNEFKTIAVTRPLNIPGTEQYLLLVKGDTLLLTNNGAPGKPAVRDDQGHAVSPATVSISPPEVFNDVRAGEAIWFDDGRIGGIVRSVLSSLITVEITHAGDFGEKLRACKGVNLPETDLHLPAITERDVSVLEFIVKHADMVGYSFAQDASGFRELQTRLEALDGGNLGIILKIETRRAFEHLPELLLAGLERSRVGVMIARGDLAVECGFERLAEVQEEILWLCEAAHLPVIWATQVLEGLTKNGMPSRAEITDAAMAGRAECVMLNKGPHIVHAVDTLDDILRRMESHQAKKRSRLCRLHLAATYSQRQPEAAVTSQAPAAEAVPVLPPASKLPTAA